MQDQVVVAPPTAKSQLKEGALLAMLHNGGKFWHPSLSMDSIIEAAPNNLKLRLPVSEMVDACGVSTALLEGSCQLVSRACWEMGEDQRMAVEDVHQSNLCANHSLLPEPHEELIVKAKVIELAGSLPQLQFYAVVVRDGVACQAVMGSSTLYTDGVEYGMRAAGRRRVITDRPARVIPEFVPLPPIPAAGVASASQNVPRAPQHPPTAGSIGANPTVPFIRPNMRVVAWDPSRLTARYMPQWMIDFPVLLTHKYMCLSIRPRRADYYTELDEVLERIGARPRDVAFSDLHFLERRQYVYYFDALSEAAQRNLLNEEHWFKKFSKDNLRSADRSFIALALPIKEIYRTMLIATRRFIVAAPRVDRHLCVRDPQELRQAFRSSRVMEVREEVDGIGSKLLRRLRTEVGL